MDVKDRTATTLMLEGPTCRMAGVGLLCVAGLFVLLAVAGAEGVLARLVSFMGAILIAGWGLLVLCPSRVIFDTELGHMRIERWFLTARCWTVPLEEVTEFYLFRSRDMDGGPDGYLLFANTSDGDVQLSLAVANETTARNTLETIAAFCKTHALQIAFPDAARTRKNVQSRRPDIIKVSP